MTKRIALMIFGLLAIGLSAQQTTITRPVLTGAPFLRVAPDARSGGVGDQGVATTSDVFSQYWNASKYLFSKNSAGLGLSYTPYLSNLTNDVFLLNATFHTFLGDEERSNLGVSVYYFNLGEIQLNNIVGNQIVEQGIAKPNEFSIDASYGLKLSDYYSMAITGRYIRSDLFNNVSNTENSQTKAASSFAVDIAGYFQSEQHSSLGGLYGRVRSGFQISNVGPKLDYSDSDDNSSFLPTNLRLGLGYDLFMDDYNRIGINLEAAKLLVPTPQEDGTIPDDGVISGIFNSFSDAPGGGSEEFKEITYSIAAEYSYNDQFSFRTGYFHESPEKGARQYLTLGAGLKYQRFGIDVSYLITTSKVNSALDNTLRFGLTWNMGEDTYYAY